MSRALINAATAAAVTAHAPVVPKIVSIPRGSDPNFSATPLIFYRVVLRRTSTRSFVKRVCTVTPRGVLYLCTSDARATRSCFLGHATRALIDGATLTIEMRDLNANTTVNFSICEDSANPACTLRMLVNIVRFFSPGASVCDANDSENDDDALSSNADGGGGGGGGGATDAAPKRPELHQDVARFVGSDQHERTKNVFAGLGGLRAHVLAVEAGLEDDPAEAIADAHQHRQRHGPGAFVDAERVASTDGDVNANFKPPIALKLPSLFDNDGEDANGNATGGERQSEQEEAVLHTSERPPSPENGANQRRHGSDPTRFTEASPVIPQQRPKPPVEDAAASQPPPPQPAFLEVTPALAVALQQHGAALKKPPAPLQQRARALGSVTSPEDHHAMMRFALVAYVTAAGTPGNSDGGQEATEPLMLTVNHTGVAHVWRGKDAVVTFDATERTRKLHVRTECDAVLTLVLPGVGGGRPVGWGFTVRAPPRQGFGGPGSPDKSAADVMRRLVATFAALNSVNLSVEIDKPPLTAFGAPAAATRDGGNGPTPEQRERLGELRRAREAAEEEARRRAEAAELEREAQSRQLAAMLRPSAQAEQRMAELRQLVRDANSDAQEAARFAQLEAAGEAMRQGEARQTALGCLVGMICDRQRRALHEARLGELTARSRIYPGGGVGGGGSSRGTSASPMLSSSHASPQRGGGASGPHGPAAYAGGYDA